MRKIISDQNDKYSDINNAIMRQDEALEGLVIAVTNYSPENEINEVIT